MNVERYTFDTNLLFYALDPDAGAKYQIASELVGGADYARAVLMLQTLGELCNSVRKKRPSLFEDAVEFVQKSAVLLDVVHAVPSDLADALGANRQHNLPFWDAMLWSTARRAGCTLLLTEDLQDGRTLGGVTFRNPFLLSRSELYSLLF